MNFNEAFKQRTKQLALDIIALFSKLPKRTETQILGKQMLRSATSVAANYRAMVRARSDRERYAKLCIVVEEADETLFWLELLEESHLIAIDQKFKQVKADCLEIVKVMASYRAKLKK